MGYENTIPAENCTDEQAYILTKTSILILRSIKDVCKLTNEGSIELLYDSIAKTFGQLEPGFVLERRLFDYLIEALVATKHIIVEGDIITLAGDKP